MAPGDKVLAKSGMNILAHLRLEAHGNEAVQLSFMVRYQTQSCRLELNRFFTEYPDNEDRDSLSAKVINCPFVFFLCHVIMNLCRFIDHP